MFNFNCDECGRGNVRAQVLQKFETKVRGNPFTVPEAVVGICDNCRACYFDPNEVKRWRELYDAHLERSGTLLSATEISAARVELRLSIGDFAALIGSTRQSVYNWERRDRNVPQNRTVDLLIRLVRDSAESGRVDVIALLLEQARILGRDIRMSEAPPFPRCRDTRARCRFAPRDQFDRLYSDTQAPRPVPALVVNY